MTQEAAVPASLMQQIKRMIDDGVAEGLRSAPLRNASISGGSGLNISGGGDLVIDGGRFRARYSTARGSGDAVYVGDMYSTSDGSYLGTGLLLQAPDGTDLALFRYDEIFGRTRWDLYDSGNRVAVGNDAFSGLGLARPYVGGGFAAYKLANFQYSTTASAFETVAIRWVTKQHPNLRVTVQASMDTAATTGEMRVLVDGVQLGATTAEAFAISTRDFGPAPIAGGHMQRVLVEIQGRRTSASGTLRIEPMDAEGVQS